MNVNATTTEERNAPTTTLEQRDVRALTECMSVLGRVGRVQGADEIYLVVSQSGKEYLVDVFTGACECPDHEYNDNHCKHRRGVEFATGRREIPEWVDRDAINNTLGVHIDENPVFAADVDAESDAIAEPEATPKVATDGGVAVHSHQTPTQGRPEDCSCLSTMDSDDLGCFPCYLAGFDTANPNASEGSDE